MKRKVGIEGMTCGHCVGRVEGELKKVKGVSAVKVDLKGKSAVVEGSGFSDGDLSNAVAEAGYHATGVVEG